MSNKQQTALDWYIEQHNILAKLSDNLSNGEIVKRISDIEKQAKEMEKVKQKYFFDCGRQYQLTGEGTFNQVYNETYGGNK
jgi:hypothetical protein